ncbi:60S ribosomal protein L7A [Perkinsus chesapeaki]|uniref:60S ribosomal protein L7a n=1 Tax=Perkinsus chesapeaki TaxID=330153 RepID=A0A7J6MA15_PERCH|nr:60S ribosomal protein L7A [Perkinsus chesapeaki]
MAPKATKTTKKGKTLPAVPQIGKVEKAKAPVHGKSILPEKKTRSYGIGQDVQPRRDLTRYVRWPKNVNLQRKKAILMQRLKVPPMINQFTNTLNKNQATHVLKFLSKYRPESPADKRARLMAIAKAKEAGEETTQTKPTSVAFGLNKVTSLVEQNKAKLVVIASDVDPIELIVWLPTLCRKKDVPYCIIKGKSRLGQLVGKKTASVVAVTEVGKEDAAALETIQKTMHVQYNENTDIRRHWGGGIMGQKSNDVIAKREKALADEAAKKMAIAA